MADVGEGTEGLRGASATPSPTPTIVRTGGIDCETVLEPEPEREAVGAIEEGGTTDFDEAEAEAEVVVVAAFVEVGVEAEELSAGAGVNTGSGVVTFAGEAPALRVEGGRGGGFEVSLVRVSVRGVRSELWSICLSLLPTDFAR